MAISLYPHNASAYEAAVAMLAETGKAAIVHPTGTGKSVIGFKLCEDHPDKTICWLSPSEYIFQTQLENLKAAADGYIPENICFFTYARLMLMDAAELAEIRPDTIILDEFHRCGAEQWGQGVQNLLRLYPEVPILGLTATNIRYLDRQRDMADELFDSNIASEMTLGEAVVRDILNPPRYVLSVFSYQQELEKYQHRIKKAKSKASRQAAEEYFAKLRRALENAEGLDAVFDRHMTDRTGKYLVFCSNAEHMDEMIAKAPDWFGNVDSRPHIYRAYADDPSASKAFASFKADSSEHLKLLFCIDMLNEGVHVDNISGVILLRPTISPIIYKQQIGRALAAGAKKDAVIFDIVLNIENLYSIGSIQDEMQAAITYYRYLGQYENIVNEHFTVIDETQDCKRLFAELEQRLNCSWNLMYAEAKKYFQEHGNLIVPAKYKTVTGLSLGNWLNIQRKIYNGKAEGFLTEEQIEKLDALNIVWDNYHSLVWEKSFLEAKAYYERFHDLRVPVKYVTETGFPLGMWITMMRQARANRRFSIVTEERIKRLDEIGMSWNVLSDQWERNYLEAAMYYRQHGNLLVPARYVTESGIKLGYWIAHLRQDKRDNKEYLTKEQIDRLNLIGMAWDADEERWRIGYEAALHYSRAKGNLDVPFSYETPDGFRLGLWIQLKRRQYNKGTLSNTQVRDLERIGMRWDVHAERWQEFYEEAQAYFAANGNLKVPRAYKTANGHDLCQWVRRMKREQDRLNEAQITALNALGLNLKPTAFHQETTR